MSKYGFYVKLESYIEKIVMKDLMKGNPGIGGTQYLFLMVAFLLRQRGYDIVIFSDIEELEYGIIKCHNNSELSELCVSKKIKKLVVNAYGNDFILNDELLYKNGIKVVFWAHNTLDFFMRKKIVNAKNIPLIVCVSENQYKNMKGTGLEAISTYVNNFITSRFYDESTRTSLAAEKVIYIGALFPNKGCHNLIKIWKLVNKCKPNAQLVIIGGSSIYGSKVKTGTIGVTDKVYEMLISHYWKRIDNPSTIKFVGGKSWKEIPDLISDAKVGIINPSHFQFDETFCMSAVELEAYGIPIISRYRNDGLSTTVLNGVTGYLYEKDKDIASAVVSLMDDKLTLQKMSDNAREYAKRFIEDESISRWEQILADNCSCEQKLYTRFRCKDIARFFDDTKMIIYKVIRRFF